jgi:hypothetical protein
VDAGADPAKKGDNLQTDSPAKVSEHSNRDKSANSVRGDSQTTASAEVPQRPSGIPIATPTSGVAASSTSDHSNTIQPEDQSKNGRTSNDDRQPELVNTPSNPQKDVADVTKDDPKKSKGNTSAVPNNNRGSELVDTPSNHPNEDHPTAIPEPQKPSAKDSATKVD